MTKLLEAVTAALQRGDSADSQWPDKEGEFWALCPFHTDTHAGNFSVSERGYNCFSCQAKGSLKALAEHLGLLDQKDLPAGCTLDEYAAAKRLPIGFLKGLGISDKRESRGKEKVSVLQIPYKDEQGKLLAMRRRQALKKRDVGADNRFLWRRGDKPALYGLWRLEQIKQAGWVLLVEGESDCHTAWLYDIPALGIPGAKNWKREWVRYLVGLDVYVWQEPDEAGRLLVVLLATSFATANVKAKIISSSLNGWKDISDANSQGGDVRALLAEAKKTATPLSDVPTASLMTSTGQASAEIEEESHYELIENVVYHFRPKPVYIQGQKVGVSWQRTKVLNFSAQITREIQRLDGDEQESVYTVNGQSDRPFMVEIVGDDFRDERLARGIIGNAAGARAIIYEPKHLPLAIQELSNGFQTEVRFLSTGWQRVSNRLLFITPQASAGYCEVSDELSRYHIAPGDLAQGLDALVHGLLEAFPHEVTYPCVAHAFLPPLFRWITSAKRYVLHLVGETGSLKTAYACALLCLYGPGFVDEEPTEKWSSTINKIERLGYDAKDVLYLVDDYKGRYTRLSDVTQLIQNYSESRGKGRLNRDSTIKHTYWIRGALLSTGEDIPEGEASVVSRMLIVRLRRPEGTNDALRYAQERAMHLNVVMYEYTNWLARNETKETTMAADQKLIAWRDEIMARCPGNSTNPGRLAMNLAQNKLAWTTLASFLVEQKAWSEAEAQQHTAEYDGYAQTMLEDMAQRVQKQKASVAYLMAIAALLSSGEAVLMPRYAATEELGKPPANKVMLGWKDTDHVYLLPDVAYYAAEHWYHAIGRTLGFTSQAIESQLVDDGMAECSDGLRLRVTVTVRILGEVRRVLKLKRDALYPTEDAEESDDLPF